jgi:hypothetical protein
MDSFPEIPIDLGPFCGLISLESSDNDKHTLERVPPDLDCLRGPSLWRTFQKFFGALASTKGGLEIVFNQQLTRLGFTSLTASLFGR